MTRQQLVKAVARLNPEGDRIGLDSILQHIEHDTKHARQANLNGIKLHHGRPAEGDLSSNDAELVTTLLSLMELCDDLTEFLTAVIEDRPTKSSKRQS